MNYEENKEELDRSRSAEISFCNSDQASISEIIGYSAQEIEQIYSGGLTGLNRGEGCGQNRNAHPVSTGIAVGGI